MNNFEDHSNLTDDMIDMLVVAANKFLDDDEFDEVEKYLGRDLRIEAISLISES